MNITNVKVGDTVTRLLAGIVEMKLTVGYVDEKLVYCHPQEVSWEKDDCWTFDKETGIEIDEELGWGFQPDGSEYTGSYIVDVETRVLN